jgi:hypothetical protein
MNDGYEDRMIYLENNCSITDIELLHVNFIVKSQKAFIETYQVNLEEKYVGKRKNYWKIYLK